MVFLYTTERPLGSVIGGPSQSSQKSFVLRVQPLWQTHHPWEGLTLAVPLHTVYLRVAAEAPSHPALRRILYNLWKMSHTQQHRTPLLPATPAHRT